MSSLLETNQLSNKRRVQNTISYVCLPVCVFMLSKSAANCIHKLLSCSTTAAGTRAPGSMLVSYCHLAYNTNSFLHYL